VRRRLLRAEQPLPRFELTFPSRAARLCYALRCRVPFPIKVLAAELLGRLDRRLKPAELAEARTAAEAIVAGTRLAGQVEAIARRRLVEERLREAAFWRARFDRDRVVGAANMHAALAQGRGVILSFCHVGSFHGSIAPLSRHAGRTTYIATNSWLLEPPDGSEWGLRIEHWRRRLAAMDGRVVQMPGTFQTLGALLDRGDVTMIAFDMPGNSETRFLGKPVMLTSGTAKLALKTDALVLPLRPTHRGLRLGIEFGRPVDPRQHLDARSLQSAIAAIHEEWILERPAALEDPSRPGAWEGEARPSGWGSPRR
jgi:lauroyl/myristoyl acyltransferase